MEFYKKTQEELFEVLKTRELGLTEKEVITRSKLGKNQLLEEKKESKIVKFLKGFKNLMIVVLIFAAIISFVVALYESEPFTDSIIILIIVFLNAFLSFVQEQKADESLEHLRKLQVNNILVKRNNEVEEINARDLVVGDIIILEAGNTVPADARILSSISLKTDESSLTGESTSVSKNSNIINEVVSIAHQKNMLFSGTNIVLGKCEAVVTNIGMDTQLGKIAHTLSQKDELTPLQIKIDSISKVLSLLAFLIIIIMFIIGVFQGLEIMDLLMLSISLAVAAIPEGLPAVITIVLSVGMNEMAKKKVIVRKMSSVETLGSTQIICSDKTGTITQNKMTVEKIFYDYKIQDKLENELFKLNLGLCNNVIYNETYLGDPTEIALYRYVNLNKTYKRTHENPFDSERKMMSVTYVIDNKNYLFVKGSFDSIIKVCDSILIDGNIKKITNEQIRHLKEIEEQYSKQAYRLLAFAYKKSNDNLETNLIFQGFAMLIDPPRSTVKKSIEQCKQAGIRPIMITGDSLNTATSIAKNVGILTNESEAITGVELDKIKEEDLVNEVLKYSVYARVSPKNKFDIVSAWQKNNKVVAMTGDGVNDAPALKKADIGVGMGITGSEVSKNVSDIILTDDNFSSIVEATKEGRRIYDNIKIVLTYLLTGNLAEVLVIFIGMIFGFEVFLPIQILYINLVTDSIPAIALAFENSDDDIIKRKPRKKGSSFFTPFLIAKIMTTSILKTIAILVIFFATLNNADIQTATTLAFLNLIMLEIIFGYSCKNLKQNVINKNIFDNKQLNIGTIILIVLQVIIFTTPLKHIFDISYITFEQVLFSIILVFIIFIIDEATKPIITKLFKDE